MNFARAMEVSRLVLDYLRALAWPSVVALCVLILRRQLREAVDRVVEIGMPGGASLKLERKATTLAIQAEHAEAVDERRKEVEGGNPVLVGPLSARYGASTITKEQMQAYRSFDANMYREAIERRWQRLIDTTREVARQTGLPSEAQDYPMSALATALVDKGLPTDIANVITGLQEVVVEIRTGVDPTMATRWSFAGASDTAEVALRGLVEDGQ